MEKVILFFTLFLSGASVFAGSLSQVGLDAKGNMIYKIRGCFPISYFIDENYTTVPVLGRNNNSEDIVFCINGDYTGKDKFDVLPKIAEDALGANCFKTTIDGANKTVVFEFLSENKKLVIEEGETTFTLEGHEPVLIREAVRRVENRCILDPQAVDYYEEIMKHPLPED